ncbi:MAG: hypothetical protein [Microviridae sp.]|nr:MAG: hypothetical protein [Microviridae sp.]
MNLQFIHLILSLLLLTTQIILNLNLFSTMTLKNLSFAYDEQQRTKKLSILCLVNTALITLDLIFTLSSLDINSQTLNYTKQPQEVLKYIDLINWKNFGIKASHLLAKPMSLLLII